MNKYIIVLVLTIFGISHSVKAQTMKIVDLKIGEITSGDNLRKIFKSSYKTFGIENDNKYFKITPYFIKETGSKLIYSKIDTVFYFVKLTKDGTNFVSINSNRIENWNSPNIFYKFIGDNNHISQKPLKRKKKKKKKKKKKN